MTETNEFERDFEAVAAKRFPGRFDPRELQNIPDVGDGSPGLQRAFRNYLHEGGIDKALDMNNHDIEKVKDLDVDGDVDIEGDVDVNGTTNLDNTDIDGTLDVSGDVDLHSDLDLHNGNLDDVATIDGGGNAVQLDDDISLPSNNITLGAGQTVDGIDVSAIGLDNMPTAPTGDIPVNSQQITGLANGVAAQDAMALGQKYTDINARASINDIFGADGKADSDIDMDENSIESTKNLNLKEQASDPISVASNVVFFSKDGELYYRDEYFTFKIDHVKGWNAIGSVFLQSFDVSGKEANVTGGFLSMDGLKMYIIGIATNSVNEYTLSVAWDISSATWVRTLSVVAKEGFPNDVFFNNDGSKMYIVGTSSDAVHEYDLSTEWNISTAVWLQEFDISAKLINARGMFFRNDGLKMYVAGSSTTGLHEYDLSVAWDISSAVWLQYFNTSTKEVSIRDMFFSYDGLKMYTTGTTSAVNEYDLSVAWDISTLVWLQVFSVTTQDNAPRGVFLRYNDGLKMYITGNQHNYVYEYDLKKSDY